MNDIVKIAQNLRKEHLFVNEQKQQIKTLNEKISSTCDCIFHVSWILRQQRLTLYELIYSRKELGQNTSTCEKANLIEQASFIDAYKALNNDSYITELLSSIRNNPDLISECLMQNTKDTIANKQDCESVAQILMSSVYGNAILHEDYMLTLRLLRNLIDKQLAPSDDPRRLLRQISAAFSAVFKAFTESLLEAKLFLNSTLNDSILHVLGEDEFMLEIDPNKAAIRFAAQERHRQSSTVNPSQNSPNSSNSNNSSNNNNGQTTPSAVSTSTNTTNSSGNQNNSNNSQQQAKLPEFASNTKLYKTYVTNRLVSFTAKFIEGIRDNIHCLPPSLLWIIKYVYLQLTNEGKLTDRQIRTVCSDLLFSSFICPAILYPDYYGVTDAYISPNGRFNLAQVAQIIQWLAVTNYEKEVEEESLINIDTGAPTAGKSSASAIPPTVNPNIAPRLNDIYSKFPADCVSSILDYVLSNTCDIDQAVDSVANCKDVSRTCFLITESELSLLVTFLEPIVPKLNFEDTELKDALIETIKKAITSFKFPLESHIKCKLKDKQIGSHNPAGPLNNSGPSSAIGGALSHGSSSTTNVSNSLVSNSNGSPRSRRNNMLRRVTRKGFRSSSSSNEINNAKGNESQCRCLACAGYQVLMVPFINRNTTNYITTILPEEKVDQTPMIENSEVASVNSVASSSLELENENDNLSDMVSAHVSSGRATPNVSGRNTPSQASSDNNNAEHIDVGIIQGPLVDFSNDLPDVVQKESVAQPVARANDPAPTGPAQNAELEIEDRFCKFDFKLELGVDETKSLLSDTWSTDVMASDCDFLPNFDGEYSALSYNAARLGLLNLRADDSSEPILRQRWPMMEPLISYADTASINDIKKKLRLVFGSVDLLYIPQPATLTADSPNDNENELVKYLKVLLSNASRLDSIDSVAIRETIRCVKPFSNNACQELLRSVLDDYDRRSTYMKDLVEFHQRLLIVSFRLENVLHHIERDKLICNHNLVTLFVGQYMEQKERSVQFFIRKFQSINAADEKTQLVEKFLNLLYNALENDSNWHRATQDQIDHARRIIERHIMTQIYWSAFYPNGEADVHRDKVLHEHMKKLSKIINVDHKDLRIPKVYHSEYPWPSAQAEIEVINSCKAARDKISCVVKCCKTIMTLLSIADEKHSPSADDLMPVLVFVVIQTNPNSLLSTVQYVNSFYEKHFHGEQAYWWTQFCSAIEFIKTMDYWETQ